MNQFPVMNNRREAAVKSIAIAQPTFLPWLGWYDLVDQVDKLILLDDVAFSKQSWQQRNRIRTRGGLSYLTVPVHTAGRLGQRIAETQIVGTAFVEKILRTVAQNYRRAEYFERYYPDFCTILENTAGAENLCNLNCGLIEWLSARLGVTTPSVRSSQLGVGGKRGTHVAMLCEHMGAHRYISPPGAEDYLIEDRVEFDRRSIEVEIHVYDHPVYKQCFEPFEPHASALDLLFNEGDRAGAILRSGRRPARPLGRKPKHKQYIQGHREAMNVAFRVDSSGQIGTGHFIRCLALADTLRRCGWYVRFVSRHLPGNLQQMLIDKSHSFSRIGHFEPQPIDADVSHAHWLGTSQLQDAEETIQALSDRSWDWLIVDHYSLNERWESMLRKSAANIAVIDDLADRAHNCDLLLDQNLHVEMEARYAGKVPPACKLLLGPAYALLREEFAATRSRAKSHDGVVERILIFFGGVDSGDYTSQTIDAIAGLRMGGLRVDVVVGSGNTRKEQIVAHCLRLGFYCHVHTDNMAELMAAADLAIGAGGTATWERCCVGLPTLAISIADNQKDQLIAAACEGLLYAPERHEEFLRFIQRHTVVLVENRFLRQAISRAGLRAVDGCGVARVLRNLTRVDIELRAATLDDSPNLFNWRNHPSVRAVSRIHDVIDWHTHQKWYAAVLKSVDRVLLIGECQASPIGVVRFDVRAMEAEISIYLVPGTHPPGQGRSLLLCAERWISANRPGVARIRARVLAGNERSVRLFKGTGYYIEFTDLLKVTDADA